MGFFGDTFEVLLGTFWYFWVLLGTVRYFWLLLDTFEYYWHFLVLFSTFKYFLVLLDFQRTPREDSLGPAWGVLGARLG